MSSSDKAWELWDHLVAEEASPISPWAGDGSSVSFQPDFALLERLLAVPIALGATTQSGLPAKAVDVWVSQELRRSGFAEDIVWPRPSPPRVVSRDALALVRSVRGGEQRDDLK